MNYVRELPALFRNYPWVLLYSAAMSITLASLIYQFESPHTYTDIISSQLTLQGGSPLLDVLFFALFSLLLLLITTGFLFLFAETAGDPDRNRSTLTGSFAILSIPAVVLFAGALFSNAIALNGSVSPSLLFSLFVPAIFLAGSSALEKRVPGRLLFRGAAHFTLSALFLWGSTGGLLGLFSHLGILGAAGPLLLHGPLLFVSAFGFFSLYLFKTFTGSSFAESLRSIRGISQAGLPLLWLNLAPKPVYELAGDSVASHYSSLALLSAAVFICLFHYFLLIGRSAGNRIAALARITRPRTLLLFSFLALVFLFHMPQPAPLLTEDWFHGAPFRIPWQQTLEFGKVPYVDFFPQMGLSPYWYGAISELLFGGQYAMMEYSAFLLTTLLKLGIVFLMFRFWGSLPALIAALALPFSAKAYPLVFAVLLLAAGLRRFKRLGWIALWALLLPLVYTYVPVAGTAFVFATVPLLVYSLARLRGTRLAGGIAILLTLSLLIILTPALNIFAGFLEYFGETRAFSVATFWESLQVSVEEFEGGAGVSSSLLLFYLLRFSWLIMIVAVFVMLAWKLWHHRKPGATDNLPLLAASAGMFLVLGYYGIYSISTSTVGRSWDLLIIGFAVIFPLLLLKRPSFRPSSGFFFYFLFLALIFNLGAGREGWGSDARLINAAGYRLVPVSHSHRFDADDPVTIRGLYARADAAAMITAFNGLKRVLPLEKYYDFTDTGMRYFVQNSEVPTYYSLWQNASSTEQQRREIDLIEEQKIPLALIGPQFYPSYSLNSLRAYHIYRYLMLNYRPYRRDVFTFMLRRELLDAETEIGSADIAMLEEMYPYASLGHLPVEWGESLAHLQKRFAEIEPLPFSSTVNGNGVLTLTLETVNNKDSFPFCDMIIIELGDLDDRSRKQFSARLSWRDERGLSQSLELMLGPGKNLVPLGAFPRWFFARNVTEIHLLLETRQQPEVAGIAKVFLPENAGRR